MEIVGLLWTDWKRFPVSEWVLSCVGDLWLNFSGVHVFPSYVYHDNMIDG